MSPTGRRGISRREFLQGAALALAFPSLARSEPDFALPADAAAAIAESPLVYVTPLRSDGTESVCHAEVWFAQGPGGLFVVTGAERWRARAIARGLDRARLWVGDFGVWKKAGDRYRSAPSFVAIGELVAKDDARSIESALASFGAKYSDEWGKWGPRFSRGLADGSRVLIRYRPVSS